MKVSKPRELLPHVAENIFSHIRENADAQAGFCERLRPGEHRLVDGAPHEHIVFNEAFNVGSCQLDARVGCKLLPVRAAVQSAHVVGEAMRPVMTFKCISVEAGDGKQVSQSRRFLRMAQYHSVIEDDSTNRHEKSSTPIMRERLQARYCAPVKRCMHEY